MKQKTNFNKTIKKAEDGSKQPGILSEALQRTTPFSAADPAQWALTLFALRQTTVEGIGRLATAASNKLSSLAGSVTTGVLGEETAKKLHENVTYNMKPLGDAIKNVYEFATRPHVSSVLFGSLIGAIYSYYNTKNPNERMKNIVKMSIIGGALGLGAKLLTDLIINYAVVLEERQQQ